jgi:pimeloyl-ACP methyl ester carboxylesterase
VSGQTKPTIVFAHGLWADGSCYSKVIPRLLADGFQVISTQNHLNTVADDVTSVRTSFTRAAGPVVLVGHSYGGTVITAAGADERVAALVYICAFAPEEGDATLVDQNKYPPTPIFKHIEIVDGRIWLGPSGVQNLPETCRRQNKNWSGLLRWRPWPIFLISPCPARPGNINPRLTLLVLMTGPYNLTCNASWPSV